MGEQQNNTTFMDHHYLSIFSTAKQSIADQSCGILEENRIPVMLERVQLQQEGRWITGYRIRVPAQTSSLALRVLGNQAALSTQVIVDEEGDSHALPSILALVNSSVPEKSHLI